MRIHANWLATPVSGLACGDGNISPVAGFRNTPPMVNRRTDWMCGVRPCSLTVGKRSRPHSAPSEKRDSLFMCHFFVYSLIACDLPTYIDHGDEKTMRSLTLDLDRSAGGPL